MEQIAKLPPACCGTCLYFNSLPPDPGNLKAPAVGFCRRYPPTSQILGMTQNQLNRKGPPEIQTGQSVPQVPAIGWCGEYHTNVTSPA